MGISLHHKELFSKNHQKHQELRKKLGKQFQMQFWIFPFLYNCPSFWRNNRTITLLKYYQVYLLRILTNLTSINHPKYPSLNLRVVLVTPKIFKLLSVVNNLPFTLLQEEPLAYFN